MKSINNFGVFEISLPKSVFDVTEVTYKEFVLRQDAQQHDMVRMRWASRRIDRFNTLAPGTPISIKYKSQHDDNKAEFVGYITHLKPILGSTKYFEFDIYAVATSRVFRQTGQEVWTNKTAPEIVSEIAKDFGMKATVRRHGIRWPQVAQRGRSYWELMSQLANQIGYGLTVRGTEVLFLPITDFVDSSFDSAPYLSAMEAGPGPEGYRIRVETVTSVAGTTNETGSFPNDASVVTSIDPVKGLVATSRKSPGSALKRSKKGTSPFVAYSTAVAHSKGDTELLAEGRAQRGLMSIDAEVYCSGSAELRPYMPVYLESKNPELTGWWIVKSVTHQIRRDTQNYTCDVVISTDTLGRSAIPPRSKARARNIGREVSRGIKQTPSRSRLRQMQGTGVVGKTVGGRWRWEAV